MLASLLNTPHSDADWRRWAFDNAQDHLDIIDRLRKTTGNVTSVTLTNGGSGYTSIPSVSLDPNGSGATFYISIKGGVIQSLQLKAHGTGYRSSRFVISGGGGSGATGTITVNPWVNLTVYQLDPINFLTPKEFIWRHAQTHNDMNQALGLQSVDLSEVDIKDQNKLAAWIYSNYQEHNNVHERLGI